MSVYLTDAIVEAPISLVISKGANGPNAMTASCFSEVAHHPTSLWISVAKTAFTHELIRASGDFTLAVLHVNQAAIARACGAISGRDSNKCAGLPLYDGPDGFVFLEGALTSTACKVKQRVDCGDHTLFIADILSGHLESRRAHLRHLLTSDL